jgi:hypothetical protein
LSPREPGAVHAGEGVLPPDSGAPVPTRPQVSGEPPLSAEEILSGREQPSVGQLLLRNRSVIWGGALLAIMVLIAMAGPLFTAGPTEQNVAARLKPPGAEFWFGTDFLGRDVLPASCTARASRSSSASRWRCSRRPSAS